MTPLRFSDTTRENVIKKKGREENEKEKKMFSPSVLSEQDNVLLLYLFQIVTMLVMLIVMMTVLPLRAFDVEEYK